MSFRQFREIRLRDFRCFCEEQKARLAPLTLLVGDNSRCSMSDPKQARVLLEAAEGMSRRFVAWEMWPCSPTRSLASVYSRRPRSC